MQFDASKKEPKATIIIDGITYKVYAPTLGQTEAYRDKFDKCKTDDRSITELMKSHIEELGSIPKEKLQSIDYEMFIELFTHVTSPKKK